MHQSILSVCVISLALIGCQSHAPEDASTAGSAPGTAYGQYVVSGGVAKPGPRPLAPGDTVAVVIARNLPAPPSEPITIVLIRHAPEGTIRQLIQLNAHGQLMDEEQNFALRNGDELIFPGGKETNSTGNPTMAPQRGPG
jgi:hypothetical protein